MVGSSSITTPDLSIPFGAVSDNFGERIEQKIFHAEIVVDSKKVKAEEEEYKHLPVVTNFIDEDGNDMMESAIQNNYRTIKEQVKRIVAEEKMRIAADPELRHLLDLK